MNSNISSLLVVASLTNISTANYFIKGFRDAGCRVFACSDVESPLADFFAVGTFDVFALCQSNYLSPDLVLFIEGGSMRLFPVGLHKLTCKTAWYGIDTHMDYQKHLKIGRLFDISFIAQKEYVPLLKEDGLKQVYWLPLAFAPELLPELLPTRTIDIAYVGSDNVEINPQRHALLAQLRKNFPSHYFGLANPKKMAEIYCSAFIVFNKSVKNDINMRFFEAMGTGAILITDPILLNGLEDLFVENEHYLVYRSDDELLTLVNKLLADKKLCSELSTRAQANIMASHTYSHRVAKMIALITNARKIAAAKPEDYFAACLSLNLYADALNALSQAFICSANSGFRQYIGQLIAVSIYFLSKLTHLAEWLLSKFKKQ